MIERWARSQFENIVLIWFVSKVGSSAEENLLCEPEDRFGEFLCQGSSTFSWKKCSDVFTGTLARTSPSTSLHILSCFLGSPRSKFSTSTSSSWFGPTSNQVTFGFTPQVPHHLLTHRLTLVSTLNWQLSTMLQRSQSFLLSYSQPYLEWHSMLFQSAGSWGASHYAMTNYEEYFAEGVSWVVWVLFVQFPKNQRGWVLDNIHTILKKNTGGI